MIIRNETDGSAVYKKGDVLMPSLKARVLTAIIGVPIIILILLAPVYVITGVVMVASCIGLYEYYRAVGLMKHKCLCFMGYLAAIVISMGTIYPASISLVLVYIYVVALFVMMLSGGGKITLKDLGLLVFGLIYIPYFLSHICYIRSMENGNFYIWLVFLGAFLTDSCAYFAGCCLGRHKLCPKISPKKTVEGAIGGTLGGGLSFVLFGVIVNIFFGKYLGGQLNLWLLFLLGLIVAVASQIGDLAASAIKRQFEIKDFGSCLPGHGGILDRCDSIILVAPIIFLFLYNINIMM